MFVIASDALCQTTVPIVHDMPQVSTIYIFCENQARHEEWVEQWPKIKGVFTDIVPICRALQQAAQECDQNMISISFITTGSGSSKPNLSQLDPSFMYTQIIKEILLTMDFNQQHINEFTMYCRNIFADNPNNLHHVNKLEQEYHKYLPIWWYTNQCFLYSILNRSLRMMEVDLIIRMGFFIRDLHNYIVELHKKQYVGHVHVKTFTVFRGQGLSKIDFDRMMKTQGGLLSFNNFLSTNLDRDVSLTVASSNQENPDLIGVLFEITINPSISTTAFGNTEDVSYFKREKEILFSMNSIFRIGPIKQINRNNRLWQVNLTLISDYDPDLHALTERIHNEMYPEKKGWDRLGHLLIQLGQFNKAYEVYDILLDRTKTDKEKAHLYHMLGTVKDSQGEYKNAIGYYQQSIEIEQKLLPPTDANLATSHNNIGFVYDRMGDYSNALSYHQKALDIKQKTLPSNHIDLATSYNNIASVYYNLGDYSNTLSNHRKALEIYQKTLSSNHPALAYSYNNVGCIYNKMSDYSNAFSSHQRAIEIRQKTLPSNHPDLAQSYNNIGLVYDNIGDYPNALSSYKKALEIWQKILPSNHPDLATFYNNIGSVYDNMDDYSNALLSHQKALEICKEALPSKHPDLAYSYNNIGTVYCCMGDHSKALSFLEKALAIFQNSLPPTHPHIKTLIDNINYVKKKL